MPKVFKANNFCIYEFWYILFILRYNERGETTTVTVEKDGLFDVSVNKVLSIDELQPETVFQCLLTIPGTQFSVREETMYFPDRGKFTYLYARVIV